MAGRDRAVGVCGWCGAATRLSSHALCSSCERRLEAAVRFRVSKINEDLDLMVEFDAYYHQRPASCRNHALVSSK